MSSRIVFIEQGQKLTKRLASARLTAMAEGLLDRLRRSLHRNSPSFGRWIVELTGAFSRRMNIGQRLAYPDRPEARRKCDVPLVAPRGILLEPGSLNNGMLRPPGVGGAGWAPRCCDC